MEDLTYQTLNEYIRAPFGALDTENKQRLEPKYQDNKKKISCKCVCEFEDTYLIHVLVPSESQEGKSYDVVIQFFTHNKEISKESTLDNYLIQFFSNSPSFIYKYAVLYKNKGFMIDSLQDKLNQDYKDSLPTKSNSSMKMSYDKSLYFACRFIQDNSLAFLNKKTLMRTNQKLEFRRFVDGIGDYSGSKFNREVYDIETDFRKEIKKDLLKAENVFKKRDLSLSKRVVGKREKLKATTNTSKDKSSITTTKVVKKSSKVQPRPKRSTTRKG